MISFESRSVEAIDEKTYGQELFPKPVFIHHRQSRYQSGDLADHRVICFDRRVCKVQCVILVSSEKANGRGPRRPTRDQEFDVIE